MTNKEVSVFTFKRDLVVMLFLIFDVTFHVRHMGLLLIHFEELALIARNMFETANRGGMPQRECT